MLQDLSFSVHSSVAVN